MSDVIDVAETPALNSTASLVAVPRAATNTPAVLLQMAIEQNADLDKLKQLMDLQERWEANEARKAYHVAVAAFKAHDIRISKNAKFNAGPLEGSRYANLAAWVRAVTGTLSDCGLSVAWKPVPAEEKGFIRIRCTLTHTQGHSEFVEFEGPSDTSGAKNPLQARASTAKYLERYTLEMILGITADDGEDDDGASGGGQMGEEHPQLQAGRDAAMNGEKSLTDWWGGLTAKDRRALNDQFKGLRAVARRADGGA